MDPFDYPENRVAKVVYAALWVFACLLGVFSLVAFLEALSPKNEGYSSYGNPVVAGSTLVSNIVLALIAVGVAEGLKIAVKNSK